MDQKFPKNIRQIGNVSDSTKVYIEDYVDTYFNQLCEKESVEPKGAFLIGEIQKEGQEHYILVSGAVQMQGLSYDGPDLVLGDDTWKKACEDSKKHFEGKAIVGWSMIEKDLPLKINSKLLKTHQKMFHKKNRIFVMIDAEEKEQKYFKFKFNDLMELGGHFVYYEKNPLMQDYMIAKRKENCVTPSETYEDRAAKDFRSMIKEKETKTVKKKKVRGSYLASTAVLIMALGMGVASANDYDKLLEVGQVVTDRINTLLGKEEIHVIDTENLEVELEEVEEKSEDIPVTDESEDKPVAEDNAIEPEVEESNVTPEKPDIVDEEEPQGSEEPSAVTTYIVKSGDSLASISREAYGTITKINDICEANNIKSSDYIHAGQELILP